MLVDDHALVRAGLRRLLEDTPNIRVQSEAGDGAEAIRLLRDNVPDVIVLDITMPGMDGIDATKHIRAAWPDVPILILTMHSDPQFAVRLLNAGANGYVVKQSAPAQLAAAIRAVRCGEQYLSGEVADAAQAMQRAGAANDNPVSVLTDRELQVLRDLAEGRNHHEIAERLHLSVKTIDTYRLRLLAKLRLRNNSDLTRFAIQNGLVQA
ncbi:MAG: response regulator transcription factor [Phycisphaerae bacterium]|nr:response regulator transcription factor [Phycisphaerae bacterium]